ncbi:MAG: AFG1/ZapE family ATPase, partial [Pseudomonadota bacterium]
MIVDEYERRVSAGELKPDAAQRAVLPEFDRMAEALAQPIKKGWFAKAPEPVRGLYLWGRVGRGKSMVMDLFVDQLNVPARRVHVHAFMQEIHAAMHAARQKGVEDAVEPVAADVASTVRLLAFDE